MRVRNNVFNIPSGAITASVPPTSDIGVGDLSEIAVDVNITAVTGTTPTYQLLIERKGNDGIYYPIYTSPNQSAVGKLSISMGVAMQTNVSLGEYIRITETLGGTTPNFTRSMSIVGRGARL